VEHEDMIDFHLPELGEEPSKSEKEDSDDDTIHEKMFKIATSKYNPFSVRGSESIHDFD
tara:strand:+ start:294 stop:470 length:177 start_codon:yes stop_codon:yes gene_type:complete